MITYTVTRNGVTIRTAHVTTDEMATFGEMIEAAERDAGTRLGLIKSGTGLWESTNHDADHYAITRSDTPVTRDEITAEMDAQWARVQAGDVDAGTAVDLLCWMWRDLRALDGVNLKGGTE